MIGQPEKDVAIHNISQNLAIEAEKYDFEKLEIEYLDCVLPMIKS